jgi:hypothetical protein
VREAQVDGNTAALFFSEAIGIRSGERLDERGFAVIYMTGGADDDMTHGASFIVAFSMAHISAVSDTARPATNPAMTKLFENAECADAAVVQIATPQSAPTRDPRKIRANAPVTAIKAP